MGFFSLAMDNEKMTGMCYENTPKSWFESNFRVFVVKN